jgi:protein-S-isoprenylcysteine O-methyltransferase Ste14
MIFKDPYGWFPNQLFTNLFSLLFLGVYAIEYIVQRYTNPHAHEPAAKSDRGSFHVITIALILAISLSVYFRLKNIGTLTGLFQWLGLVLMIAGSAFRQWALIHLGRFFSRSVQVEAEHRVIITGPYRWIRHPAYTGMILIYTGMIMALGTWLGTFVTFMLVTGSLLYRIRVEEQTLLTALGNEYREYMQNTWVLFPYA